MNTIASLIRTRPAEAERAVEDLSDLFRAALGTDDARSTLGEELELVRRYLDDRAVASGRASAGAIMDVDDAAAGSCRARVCCCSRWSRMRSITASQPLPEGGTVAHRGRRVGGGDRDHRSAIRVRRRARAPSRNGMALANTRARIEYHFGWRGGLDIERRRRLICQVTALRACPMKALIVDDEPLRASAWRAACANAAMWNCRRGRQRPRRGRSGAARLAARRGAARYPHAADGRSRGRAPSRRTRACRPR